MNIFTKHFHKKKKKKNEMGELDQMVKEQQVPRKHGNSFKIV